MQKVNEIIPTRLGLNRMKRCLDFRKWESQQALRVLLILVSAIMLIGLTVDAFAGTDLLAGSLDDMGAILGGTGKTILIIAESLTGVGIFITTRNKRYFYNPESEIFQTEPEPVPAYKKPEVTTIE